MKSPTDKSNRDKSLNSLLGTSTNFFRLKRFRSGVDIHTHHILAAISALLILFSTTTIFKLYNFYKVTQYLCFTVAKMSIIRLSKKSTQFMLADCHIEDMVQQFLLSKAEEIGSQVEDDIELF